MIKYEGKYDLPTSWEDITIKQYSKYIQALEKRNGVYEVFKEKGLEMSDIKQMEVEAVLYGDVMIALSGVDSEVVNNEYYPLVKSYGDSLGFTAIEYKAKGIKEFSFDGVTYKFPENMKEDTNFGQYVNALQIEAVARANNPNDWDYLANQLAHIVEFDEEWDEKKRDELGVKFLDLPMTVCFEFAFFLKSQYEIYSLALIRQAAQLSEKKKPFMKRVFHGLAGLKLYMNWRILKSLINLTKLRLTALSLPILEKCYYIWNTYLRRTSMNVK
jgi:hypothetical protein